MATRCPTRWRMMGAKSQSGRDYGEGGELLLSHVKGEVL